MGHHRWVDGLGIDFTDVRDDCESQIAGPMTDNLLLWLFDQILDLVLFVFITTNELLFLPGPPFRDIPNQFCISSVP